MTGGFRVTKASFDEAAQALSGVAADVGSVSAALLSGLAGTGGMAGDDRVGQHFSAQYDPMAAELTQLIGKITGGLHSIADGTAATGENYHAADTSGAKRMQP